MVTHLVSHGPLRMAHMGTPMTAESIAAAKAHQAAERLKVYQETGWLVADDEPFDSYTIVCPYCLAPCGGMNRGKADRAYAKHVVSVHHPHLKLARV